MQNPGSGAGVPCQAGGGATLSGGRAWGEVGTRGGREVDSDAHFGELVAVSAGPLTRAAYGLTSDRQLAEDLVQSTLLRPYDRWGRSAA